LTEAWPAAVAGKVERNMMEPGRPPRSLVVTLAALTVVSGFVDAVSFLGLGHVFTANMTGNVVLIGFAVAGAPGFSVAASLCALAAFLAGAVAGGRLVRKVGSHRRLLLLAMVTELGGVTAAAVVAGLVAAIDTGWPRYAVIGLLAASMGIRNAAVRHIGVPDMSTAVLTTTLTALASQSRLAGGTNPHAPLGATTVVSMFSGALVGAVLELHAGAAWSLGVAAAIATVTVAFFSREAPLELGLAS
jgi:uncharacterized membrane protein YoaK (UPF0700 family)